MDKDTVILGAIVAALLALLVGLVVWRYGQETACAAECIGHDGWRLEARACECFEVVERSQPWTPQDGAKEE